MCSISGIIKMGEQPIPAESLDQLLLALQHRGTDATGIAMMTNGELHIAKDNESAFRFVTGRMYKEFVREFLTPQTSVVLLHTRAATQGAPANNQNNHPVYYNDCAVIHNGWVRNDDEVFKKLGLERRAEVDSDAIRAVVDEYGLTHKGVHMLSKLEGGIASAVLSAKEPDKVLLMRNSNPIHIAMNDDFIYFASEKQAIHIASRPWEQKHNIWTKKVRTDLNWGVFPDASAWLLSPTKGLLWHQPFVLKGFKPAVPLATKNDVRATPKMEPSAPPAEEH